MKVLFIEDDYSYGSEMLRHLESAIPRLRGAVRVIKTEKEFREAFDARPGPSCQLIILDVMVQWDVRGSGSITDADARKEGYLRAGKRCLDRVRKNPATERVPVVIHSARDSEKIQQEIRGAKISEENLYIIPKSGDPGPLLEAVKQHLPRPK